MKARLLKTLLNNTGYIVNNNTNYIAVGSALCHNLISVDKKTLKVKYALDTFNEGRRCLEKDGKDELIFIWDKLHDLIKTGQIHDIINGNDEIENPLPVYYVKDGEVIETFTDAYGWPNVTIEGYEMYENTFFPLKKDAIEQGIREYQAGINLTKRWLEEKEPEILKAQNDIKEFKRYIKHLKSL